MSLNFKTMVITAPASTGQQTYSLPSNFDPKALFLTATYNTAPGEVSGHAIFSQGVGTYRDGSVQQYYTTVLETNNVATSDSATGGNSNAILKGYSDATPTVDYVASLVSFSTGATSNFVLDWTDVPASQIKVIAFVWGGSEITDACAGSWQQATSETSRDVTVATGFGQPDLLMHTSTGPVTGGDVNGNASVGLGFAKSNTERFFTNYYARDNTAQERFIWAEPVTMTSINVNGQGFRFDLDAKANWPTDGYRVLYDVSPAANARRTIVYIALKGTFTSTIGTGVVPIAGGAYGSNPLNTHAHSTAVAKGAIVWGTNNPSATGFQNAGNDLGSFFTGGSDGTTEASAGITSQDGSATSNTGTWFSDTKGIREMKFGATSADPPVVQSEADLFVGERHLGSVWNDIDTVNRQYVYTIFGDAPTTAPSVLTPNTGHLSRPGNIALGVIQAVGSAGAEFIKAGIGIIGP